MRHKYETLGIVLARTHVGEATTLVTVLTPEIGLVRARAQSLRKSGAKLAPALGTLCESSTVLVRGKEGWRVTGAVLEENWFSKLPNVAAQEVVVRVSGLLLRLVVGEAQDTKLFFIMKGFLQALTEFSEEQYEAVEIIAVLRILAALGLDAGEVPGETSVFTEEVLVIVREQRMTYIARINSGITASGL